MQMRDRLGRSRSIRLNDIKAFWGNGLLYGSCQAQRDYAQVRGYLFGQVPNVRYVDARDEECVSECCRFCGEKGDSGFVSVDLAGHLILALDDPAKGTFSFSHHKRTFP
jgi:hypothetical protein